MIPLALAHNLSLLVSLSLATGMLFRWFRRRGGWYPALSGLVFGAATVVGMSTPVVHQPGLIFDGRSIVLGIAGLFGGPWAAAIAASMAAACRLRIGGPGAFMGVLVILESALLGVAGFVARRRRKELMGPLGLLLLGLAIHAIMLLLMLILPDGLSVEALRRFGPAILSVYPVGFMLASLAFVEWERHVDVEDALHESERLHRSYLEHAPNAIFIADETGAYLDVNPEACRLTGYSRDELLSMRIPDLLPPVALEVSARHFSELLERGAASAEFAFLAKDGSRRWWCVDAVRLSGTRFMGFALEMTQRREALEALGESEEKFRSVVESSPSAKSFYRLDPEGRLRLTGANSAAGRLLGIDPAAMAGRTLEEVFAQAALADFPALCGEVARGALPAQFLEVPFEDGARKVCLEMRAFRTGPGAMAVDALDITERKEAEQRLRDKTEELERYFHSSLDLLCIADTSGRFVRLNPEWERCLGYPVEELEGKRFLDYVHPDDLASTLEALASLRGQREVLSFENRYRAKDGSYRWIEWRSRPIGDAIHAAARDITDRKRSEEERRNLQASLMQSQKMESLGILAGGVAHDMNNVLGAILGLASTQRGGQVSGSPAEQAFSTIITAAERGGRTVKGLLAFARQTAAEEKALALNDLIQEEMQLLEHTTLSKVRIRTDLAPGLHPIRGDAGALSHALMNLCVNAVEAMTGNGVLTLTTRNLGAEWVEVLVEDTGHGMSREIQDRALDPFYTTKAQGKGTGLGLSLVYSTVTAHGGRMELQSAPGRGTRVRLQLPACPPPAPAEVPGTAAPGASVKGGLVILVVDDDDLIRATLSMLLEALDHHALLAQGGEEALEMVEGGLRPDLVILDMNMPGLGGAGTLPALRQLLPRCPVLLATGRADQAALDLVRGDPRTKLLAKPFTMDEMADGIGDILRECEALGRHPAGEPSA